MTRYLFLASSGELNDGGLVLNRQLSEALARGNDVHLVTVGPCKERREGVNVVELDEALLSPEAAADIQQTRHFVDRISKTIRAVLDEQEPGRVGLPADTGAFDVIVGYGDVTGPAALHLRDTYYPHAKVSTVITMDPKTLFRVLNLPELGEHRAESHREVLARSDLILAHGPKSAVDARQLAAEWSRAESLPPTHEFVPGVEIAQETEPPAPWQPGDPFNVLMLGRMHDLNKGAADVALAVHDLREDGYENVRLTLRGIEPGESGDLIRLLDEQFDRDRWRSFVTMEEFTGDQAAKEQSIRESHVMVMATESEAYGLAASEYAAHGKPLIVAEGYGNGFATLLRDEERIPRDIADRFVLDDSGSRSTNGSFFGGLESGITPVERYILIAERLEAIHNDYDSYVEVAGRLRGHLEEYTLGHTAASIDQAVNDNLAGNFRHTKQGPRGINALPSQEELLQGIPEDKRALVLNPRGSTPRQPPQESVTRQDAAPSAAQSSPSSGTSASGPDRALADRVIVNGLLAERGHREASRFEMLASGMSPEEVDAAISAWEGLDKPETAREREARLGAAQTTLEAAQERAQESIATPEPAREARRPTARPENAPEPSRESPTPSASREKAPERHQGAGGQTTARTSSAIWGTPQPRLESLAAQRTEWALYDDLHGYGRRPRALTVRTPSRAPGVYEALLHPKTGAAYERDQRQAESGDRGYGE
ncbi:glycosyltransferase [Nocardiopsis dassonvillei]|uniref:glycosyltransferase n=1 Tax=Nocardiopsis dassonvillei TaxID=2014 RepID=UPI00200E552F|nr:glycosyltransferase [Nocardiopsis dassonvillei]MCK9871543.1 glycosyltransferase [Nocardiopsis dassonvillei]